MAYRYSLINGHCAGCLDTGAVLVHKLPILYIVDSYDEQDGHCVGRLHNYLCYIMWTAMMDKTGIVWDAYTIICVI